jgi:hypothetical protein
MKRVYLVAAIVSVIAGCETPTTQRYAISTDNNQAIRALNTVGIGVGTFTSAVAFQDLVGKAVGSPTFPSLVG